MEKEEVLKKFNRDMKSDHVLIRATVEEYSMRSLLKGEVKRRTYRFEVEL